MEQLFLDGKEVYSVGLEFSDQLCPKDFAQIGPENGNFPCGCKHFHNTKRGNPDYNIYLFSSYNALQGEPILFVKIKNSLITNPNTLW